MNIGIITYSRTGHTLSVAEELRQKLSAIGHGVTFVELQTVTPLKMSDTTAELKNKPEVTPYDGIVFACPVQGAMPAPPMKIYLEQIPSLAGKEVACLVTGIMPAGWGRTQTLAQMKELCESRGATVRAAESVWWLSLNRDQKIAAAVERLSRAF